MWRKRMRYVLLLSIAIIGMGFLTPASRSRAAWVRFDGGNAFLAEQVCRDGIRFGLVGGSGLADYTLTVIADRNTDVWNGPGQVVASRIVTVPETNPPEPVDHGADDLNEPGYRMRDHVAFFTLRWPQLLAPETVLRMRIEEDPNVHDPGDAIPDDRNIVTVRDCRLVDFALSMTDTPDPVLVGRSLTYTYDITNPGSTAISTRTFASTFDAASFPKGKSIPIGDGGSASPYPSKITVAELAGRVTSVEVTLQDVDHGATADLDVLLVSPSGQAVMLMSDAGGDGNLSFESVSFVDDAAVNDAGLPFEQVPDDGVRIGGARWRAANYGVGSDVFPDPAPDGSYATTLSAFHGINPNGTWNLYVVDDTSGNSTSDQAIVGGWALTLSTDRIPYRVIVQDRLPAGSTFVSAGGDGWACDNGGQPVEALVTCSREIEAPQGVPSLQITILAPQEPGSLVNSAQLTALETSTLLAEPDSISRSTTVSTLVGIRIGLYLPLITR